MNRLRAPLLMLAALVLGGTARAHAGDPPAKEDARTRAEAIRKALPAPKEGFAYEGDLKAGEYLVGTVKLSAEPSTLDEKPVWLVTEEVRRVVGESRTSWEATFYLSKDRKSVV